MKKLVVLTLLLAIGIFSVNAQLIISGEFRPRSEYAHGFGTLATPDLDPTIWTQQRTRLNINYENDFIESRISLQDIRTWGSQPQLNQSDGLSSIHEAWVKIKLNKSFALKAGRQEIIYDDHRIFGNVGWANQARSHDIAILQFNNEKFFRADLGFAYNQNQIPSDSFQVARNYKAMQVLYMQRKFGEDLNISLLFLNNGNQFSTLDSNSWSHETVYSQTIGPRVTYNFLDFIDIVLTYYIQTGKDANNIDLNASFINGELGVKLFDEKFSVKGGVEILSGTDQSSTKNENNSFTPFYGTNHKFNGHMDYFYVGNHVNNVGLQDIYFNMGYKFNKITPGIDFHLFMADGDILDPTNPTGTLDANLGTEIDFHCGYVMNEMVSFKLGYSQMFATETMEVLKGGDKDELNNWGWIMLNVTPKFFKLNK